MSRKIHALATLAVICAPTIAGAVDGAAGGATGDQPGSTAPAVQNAPPESSALETIIVTAQKRAENLQDVPISRSRPSRSPTAMW